MKTIGQLIQVFDNLESNTVRDFNVLFPNSPIELDENVAQYFLQVEIGEPVKCMGMDSQVREITVGGEVIHHTLKTHTDTASDLRYLKQDEDKVEEEYYKLCIPQESGGLE